MRLPQPLIPRSTPPHCVNIIPQRLIFPQIPWPSPINPVFSFTPAYYCGQNHLHFDLQPISAKKRGGGEFYMNSTVCKKSRTNAKFTSLKKLRGSILCTLGNGLPLYIYYPLVSVSDVFVRIWHHFVRMKIRPTEANQTRGIRVSINHSYTIEF